MAPPTSPIPRHRDERGNSIVEFAIILPVFMALVLGMFTGGMAYNRQIGMTDAVREGARYGATLLLDPHTDATQRAAWSDKVKTRTAQLSAGELTESDVCAELVLSTGTAAASASNCYVADPANSSGQWVARVRAVSTADLQAFFFRRTLDLDATAVAFYERTEG